MLLARTAGEDGSRRPVVQGAGQLQPLPPRDLRPIRARHHGLVRCGGLRSRRSSSAIVGISDAGISTSVPGRGTSSRRPRRRPDRDHPARPEPVNQVYQRADGIHRVGSSRFSPMLEEASNYGRSLPTKEEFSRVTGGELRSAHRYQGGLLVGVVGLPPCDLSGLTTEPREGTAFARFDYHGP
jgi:hypothetical protein